MILVGVYDPYGSQIATEEVETLEVAVERWTPIGPGGWSRVFFEPEGAPADHSGVTGAEIRHPITNVMELQFAVLGGIK